MTGLYSVGTTKQIDRPGLGGGERRVFRVWITTEYGNTGYVDVEPSDWNAERLREILDVKADELDLAHNLE